MNKNIIIAIIVVIIVGLAAWYYISVGRQNTTLSPANVAGANEKDVPPVPPAPLPGHP